MCVWRIPPSAPLAALGPQAYVRHLVRTPP